jgi:flavin-dependent dehydrogenase
MPVQRSDVLILGGGLAGLSLAIQLRREVPHASVRILERRPHPVPLAAFKVGESTVEIGAHYFDHVLGLHEHLQTQQIRKFGFRFFFNEGHDDLAQVPELGVSGVLPTPSFQLDRGIFENFLAQHAAELGATFEDGAVVRGIELAEDGSDHIVRYECDGITHAAQARWVVDASGRAGLLKRKLALQQDNDHDANAIWFRIGGRIAIDAWSNDEVWTSRVQPRERWRSTNHLCGPGYWAWLIPLASGSHSVGIVADARLHPLESINSFDKAMTWFAQHQPQLYRELDARRGELQDFAFLRHFSHGCKQVFSSQRWAITGEAGVFLDPFYSPGSDFIAIGNTYITALVERDLRGLRITREARLFDGLYFSFYRNMLPLYERQYPMFGHAQLMELKVTWDYAFYWGVLCQFFFQRRLTDVALFARLAEPIGACEALNREMQMLLRHAAGTQTGKRVAGFADQCNLRWFVELNRGLRDELDDAALDERLRAHAGLLHTLAQEIVAFVRACGVEVPAELSTLATLRSAASMLLREAA